MEGKSKIKELEEDEELKALRLAALATLKCHKKPKNDESKVSEFSSPINSIVSVPSTPSESESSQIPFVQTDRHLYNTHSWRKQNIPLRKRCGPFTKNNFQKASHRSNLIVISPVSLDDSKEPVEKPLSSVVLPQHKWCNSGNEDSMSPKTIRRTGPTRFNRHGSDSESSDSDYEDDSDDDSGSNETVLQDEPPEHFTRVSLESKSDAVPEILDKKRRLSFQNIDSEIQSDAYEKKETNSVYNCLKNSNSSFNYSDIRSDNYASVQNESDSRSTWGHSVENNYTTYNQYSSCQSYSSELLNSSSNSRNRKNSAHSINGESCIGGTSSFPPSMPQISSWQHPNVEMSNSYYTKETDSVPENPRSVHDRSSTDYSDKRIACDDGPNTMYFSGDTSYASGNSRNVDKDTSFTSEKRYTLSQNDLRLELKKRLQECTKKGVDQNETLDRFRQNDSWNSNKQKYTQQEDRIGEECSSYSYRSRQDQNFNRERLQNEHSSRKQEHSVNQERRKDRSSSRERSRLDLESDHSRNRHDNSKRYRRDTYSNRHKDKHDRSSSLDRSRREHSSSRDRSSHDRSSSEDSCKYDRSLSRNRRRYECSSSRDRSKYEKSSGDGKNKSKEIASPDRTKSEPTSFQDKIEPEHSKSPERNQKGMGHNFEKSQRDHSASPGKALHEHGSNRGKSRLELSSSQNRNKLDYSSSHSKPNDSFSSKSKRKSENLSCQSKQKNEDNSSQDQSVKSPQEKQTEQEYNPTDTRTNEDHPLSVQKNTHEYSRLHGESRQARESRREKFRERSRERNRKHSKSKERYRKDRSRSPVQKQHKKSSSKDHYARSRSRSSSSSSSSSYSSSSSHSSRPKIRSVPSVIKSISSKSPDTTKAEHFKDTKSSAKNSYLQSAQSDPSSPPSKRKLDSPDLNKSTSIKNSRIDIDQKNASDGNKRVPVHMRLGAFPRKRVIQMTKDVEAAFINSSSSSESESVNNKCKKKNIRIVTDIYGDKSGTDSEKKHSGKSDTKSPDSQRAKSRRLKSYR